MALQDMYSWTGGINDYTDMYGGLASANNFKDFAGDQGFNINDYYTAGGGNMEHGNFQDAQMNSSLGDMFKQQGWSFGNRELPDERIFMDAMKDGNVQNSYLTRHAQSFMDKIGPYAPLLVLAAGAAAGAGAGGAAAGGAEAGAAGAGGGAMSMGDAIAASASAEGAGGLGGMAGGLGSMPMMTPAATPGPLAESLMASGLPMSTPAPGMGLAAEVGLGTGAAGAGGMGLSGMEEPMSAANYSDAAAGYGEGMTGAETGLFDGMLGMGFSPQMANSVTNFASPIMNNPVMDEIRKLRQMMGKPVVGNLTGGDLLKGGMALNNYRQNSKNLKAQQNGLQGMFGQNSPYAQQLQQQLERRDAASGRRSQYGPRSVELQAQLAKMAAGLAGPINQISQQRQQQRGALTNTAGYMLDKGLGGLFGG
jgi:hypothetical protein